MMQKKVEAVISKIDRRKGYVKLPCGLEAFFPANEFNSLEDEGKTFLRGVIGFRYNGLGLYKFERVSENTIDQLSQISDTIDEKEKSDIQDLGDSGHAPNSDNSIYKIQHEPLSIKTIGFVDPKVLGNTSSGRKKKSSSPVNLRENKEGTVVRVCKGVYYKKDNKVQDNITKFYTDIRSIIDEDLYDGANVQYELHVEEEVRLDGSIKKKYFATNVRFLE